MAESKMSYMPQLDGLRCFAILLVMFEHYGGRLADYVPVGAGFEHYDGRLADYVPVGAGNLGVNLFFTLSGFLITQKLLDGFQGRSRGEAWASFYVARFTRLTPILYLTLFILAVFGIGTMAYSWPWHALYLSNFYIAVGGEKTVFWTLAVEEQFYLLWPFAIAFVPRRYLVHTCVAVFAFGIAWKVFGHAVGMRSVDNHVMLFGNVQPLAAGCLLGILSFRDGKPEQFGWLIPKVNRAFGLLAMAAFFWAVTIWSISGNTGTSDPRTLYGSLMPIVYAWLVINAATGFGGLIGWILQNPAIVYIGKISYGLYVIHNYTKPLVIKISGVDLGLVTEMIAGPLAFVLAALSFHFFERPVRQWGNSTYRRLNESRLADLSR